MMEKEEKILFKQLCNFRSDIFNDYLFEYATPQVLGQLFFNRMQGVAYGKLKTCNCLGKVNREFRNSLKSAYESNVKKNKSFLQCVDYINIVLSECNCKFAMLKGAYLCSYFPEGYRTSNDVDLLVLPENVSIIGDILLKAGFLQGKLINDEFVQATRNEIIESKMMRGETVPYIKRVDLPEMKYLEVDINFSMDYKTGDTDILKKILDRAHITEVNGILLQTLDRYDFIIHLCSHLYKEATTLPWVEMKRDMALYKYFDIYGLLSDMSNSEIDDLFIRANELKMEKVCAFSVLQTAGLFDFVNQHSVLVSIQILETEPDFVNTVISPKDKKVFVYAEKNIEERFFAKNRRALLKEVRDG